MVLLFTCLVNSIIAIYAIFVKYTTKNGEDFNEPSIEARVDAALFQLKVAIADKGERIAIPESRKQIALYLKSFRGAVQIRAGINRATTYEEVESALKSAILYNE